MADNNSNFKGPVREKNVTHSKRVVLSMPCPVKGVKGWSSLYYNAHGDNPNITVYTGDPDDAGNNFGRIQAKFGLLDIEVHLEQLAAVTASKDPISMSVICKSMREVNGKLTMFDATEVEVAKGQDGVVTICARDLEKPGRPECIFPFAPTRFHVYRVNGEPISEAALSVLVARGVLRLMTELLPLIADRTYKHPERKTGGGQGGGNNNRGGGGGGGYNNNRNSGGGNSNGGGNRGGGSSGGSGYDDDEGDIPF